MHAVNEEFRSSLFDPRCHSLLHFTIWGEMSPLEIPLEVRKEMEIAWHQVRAVRRMGENLKLQRLKSINRCASSLRSCIGAVCGLALSCSNKIGDVDRLTRHTLRRRFFYCFNVLNSIDSIPSFQKFCHVNSLWVPKNSWKNLASRRHCFEFFWVRGWSVPVLRAQSFFFRSKWWIHDSSPITIFKRNWSPSSR